MENIHDSPNFILGDSPFRYKLLRKILFYFNYYYDEISRNQKKKLAKIFKRDGIEVIVIQYGSNAIKIGNVCLESSIPYIIHFHGYDISTLLKLNGYSKKLKKVLNNCSAVIVVNSLQRNLLIEKFNFPSNKISVIPCGVNTNIFKPKNIIISNCCKFIMVGRLTEKKGPLLTLTAFELTASICEDVELKIIGDGDLKDELLERINVSKFKTKIKYLGSRTSDEVNKFLEESDVFLQHSITSSKGDMEGWPISIAEACSMSLPIISTLHSGIPDQVKIGKNGYLVKEFDYVGMSNYMIKMANDKQLRVKMGKESRIIIEQTGNLETQISKLKKVMKNVVNKS